MRGENPFTGYYARFCELKVTSDSLQRARCEKKFTLRLSPSRIMILIKRSITKNERVPQANSLKIPSTGK